MAAKKLVFTWGLHTRDLAVHILTIVQILHGPYSAHLTQTLYRPYSSYDIIFQSTGTGFDPKQCFDIKLIRKNTGLVDRLGSPKLQPRLEVTCQIYSKIMRVLFPVEYGCLDRIIGNKEETTICFIRSLKE